MSGTRVSCRGLGFRYDGEERPVIHDMNLDIVENDWVAILGASGSGKSTLCQLLCGLLPRSGGGARTGEVLLDGMDPAAAPTADVADAVGVLFQDPDAQLVQGIVEDEAAFGPENMRVPPAEIEERVVQSLAAVGLLHRRTDPVRSLSGGQRQRTALAAVLALRPGLFVFDDACASLDAAAQANFLQLCHKLQAEGRTLITASGRFDDVARAAGRVIVLDGGTVVQDGPPQELLHRCGEQLVQLGLLPRPAGEAASAAAGDKPVPATTPPHPAARHAELPVPAGSAPAAVSHAGKPVPAGSVPAAESHAEGARPSAVSPLLQINSLTFAYPGGREALRDINAKIDPGDWVLLTGENGSGKTTLSRLIMGLLPAPAGSIRWQGEDTKGMAVYRRAKLIGYVFQQPEYMFTAPNVWEELIYSLHGGMSVKKRPELTAGQQQRARFLLEMAGLTDRLQMSPYLLSQGEKRLLSIISQMMLERSLYILDEPTSGMDYAAIGKVTELCRYVVGEGSAVLMITHDPELMKRHATSCIHLRSGKMSVQPSR
ncbi:energy-coupling factor transport system ATP-binding protein [Paenibacillus sp. cl141a]|uniref:ABC transporter ATP-binding protein n=1 Tax=Paenibacillus sp. cl141a TaxID=1761877 RepID=UPI0008C7F43D|nr:ABC transporter ATP-binding protein [Paenibacillus sp. cl141a]SEM31695.1 energy-coupling factor transport system ATP-binding protein [Paenibacillus sp. cl141a]